MLLLPILAWDTVARVVVPRSRDAGWQSCTMTACNRTTFTRGSGLCLRIPVGVKSCEVCDSVNTRESRSEEPNGGAQNWKRFVVTVYCVRGGHFIRMTDCVRVWTMFCNKQQKGVQAKRTLTDGPAVANSVSSSVGLVGLPS